MATIYGTDFFDFASDADVSQETLREVELVQGVTNGWYPVIRAPIAFEDNFKRMVAATFNPHGTMAAVVRFEREIIRTRGDNDS